MNLGCLSLPSLPKDLIRNIYPFRFVLVDGDCVLTDLNLLFIE